MINKKNLWFLTLFSLILVLSVYYITMPNELLLTNSGDYLKNVNSKTEEKTDETKTTVTESEVITALKIASEEELQEELDALKQVLSDSQKSADEKNEAFDKIKNMNENKAKEEEIAKILKQEFDVDTFIKIEGSSVKVVVKKDKHDTALANKMMRKVQENFDTSMYISIEFK